MESMSASIADGVIRNDTLTTRAPSPPYLHVPSITSSADPSQTIQPSYDLVGPGLLSAAEVDLITGGRTQDARGRMCDDWKYEDRRKAQAILDFLYLGPVSVVRDHDWLREQGITMLLIARDASMKGLPSLSTQKAVSELGLELKYVDMANRYELSANFPTTIELINEHLLRLNGAASLDPTAKPGKVLVMCETGNDRSAAIVAAYIMAMYNRDMVGAVQFVSSQRFSTGFDEALKQVLIATEDLLKAKRMTILDARQENAAPDQQRNGASKPASRKKRAIEDTLDVDDEGDMDMDAARYEDRSSFVPFVQNGSH